MPKPNTMDDLDRQLSRLIIENRSEDGSIDLSDQGAMKDEILTLIIAKFQEVDRAKDNAYKERDMLVAALSKLFPAWIGYHTDKEWEDDWRTIIYIKLPTGQVSWHIHDSEKPLFSHLDPGLEEWDGHTTEEKYDRLNSLKGGDV